jgi:putative chitinase
MLSSNLLERIFPRCADPEEWAAALNPAMMKYEITSPARASRFLAQTGFESDQFNRLIENLHYKSPARLMKVWPKRFLSEADALPYINNEEKLANFVYSYRIGNGDSISGDGYKYRGRGILQITGRANYDSVGKALGLDLINNPDLLLCKEHAAMSAAWFWSSKGLNKLSDNDLDETRLARFTEITEQINGGFGGLKARLALLNLIESELA